MKLIQSVILLFLFISLNDSGIAQENFIKNGDFEDYSACPWSYSTPWSAQIESCVGWSAPTYGTSDYFNSCSSSNIVSVPNNAQGFQAPHSGNGYLGAILAAYTGAAGSDLDTTDFQSWVMWWEYVQGETVRTLEQNQLYKFSMYMSLSDNSGMAINEFGVHLSQTPVSKPNSTNLEITPQITFQNPSYFRDTAEWMYFEGYYLAEGNEKYVTIGNFNDYSTTDTLYVESANAFLEDTVSYYYLDDVSLIEIGESIELPNVFTPNGDNANDAWYIDFEFEDIMYVEIINRWGNLMAKGDISSFKWDGENCSDGVYFVVLKYYNSDETIKSGIIHLMR